MSHIMAKAIDVRKPLSLGYAPMEIIVNGAPQQVSDDYTAADLVEALALTGQRIAMEVNEEIVPKSGYPNHQFSAGDRIEIVHAVGGG